MAVLVVGGIASYASLYPVQETEQALVLLLGGPRRVVSDAGLHFKWPLIERVVMLEKRILEFDPAADEIIASDKKRLIVDTYTRYRIDEPLQFYRSVNNEVVARQRLEAIINSSTRRVLATVELQTVLSGERRKIMQRIGDLVNEEAEKIGLDIVDVRIKRTDLPEANGQAIYNRMQAERARNGTELRARGAEEAQRIRADAERQRTVLLAEARKRAEILRGEGDAERNRIYAEAYSVDPEFFRFYRSMRAYGKALNDSDTTLVLSPDSEFFDYFNQAGGAPTLYDGQPLQSRETVRRQG